MGALPRSVAVKVRSGTAAPSSQVSTTLLDPLTWRCSSTTCQPEPGDKLLGVVTFEASLWKASLPPAVTSR